MTHSLQAFKKASWLRSRSTTARGTRQRWPAACRSWNEPGFHSLVVKQVR